MKTSSIHIINHPTLRGYSGYSRELDGIQSEGKTIEELFDKIRLLIEVWVKSLKEIGKDKEAANLKNKEIIFSED